MPHVMFGRSRSRAGAHARAEARGGCCRAISTACFFSDSGSVAVEVAMKMAVQFWLNQGVRTRKKFLAFKGGYHGDTTGAMAVCDPTLACTRCSMGCCRASRGRSAQGEESTAAFARILDRHATSSPASSSSRWRRAPAACAFTMLMCCSGCGRRRTATSSC